MAYTKNVSLWFRRNPVYFVKIQRKEYKALNPRIKFVMPFNKNIIFWNTCT